MIVRRSFVNHALMIILADVAGSSPALPRQVNREKTTDTLPRNCGSCSNYQIHHDSGFSAN
jgi:hypothetical protein